MKTDKPIVWLHGEVKTPPIGAAARIETGTLLRRLQRGELLGLPHSRPMPASGANCHELRVTDRGATWRIVYYLDADAVVILDVFAKKTAAMPKSVIVNCRRRLAEYLRIVGKRQS
jgi:phage-related protein